MSQEAYRKFIGEVEEGGLVLIDDSLVTPEPDSTLRTVGTPASRTAEQLGKRIMANMVMVGLFTGATGLISAEAAREAIRTSVPSGSEDVNLSAFEKGLEMGTNIDSPRLQEILA
jgi:2-oxoglutarate ferredoxin oxidoreductase subunit gamma